MQRIQDEQAAQTDEHTFLSDQLVATRAEIAGLSRALATEQEELATRRRVLQEVEERNAHLSSTMTQEITAYKKLKLEADVEMHELGVLEQENMRLLSAQVEQRKGRGQVTTV
jgi:predicted metal-dependent hydrolase